MDRDLKLKLLTRLAESTSDAAREALEEEFNHAAATLKSSDEYERLDESLDVLNEIGYRFSDRLIKVMGDFVDSIESRQLRHTNTPEGFEDYVSRYSNAESLIEKSIDLLVRFRYIQAREVVRLMLPLSLHASDSVRKKVENGLDVISRYDLDTFYGKDRKGGVGAAPQLLIVNELESLEGGQLEEFFIAVIRLISGLLSERMEGATWSYNSVTLSRAATPADATVSQVRKRSIELLLRMYELSSTRSRKLSVIGALGLACRPHRHVGAGEQGDGMFAVNAIEVLDYFAKLVPFEELQIVQKIENISYWAFARTATEEVKAAARTVEKEIAARPDYTIFKTLIGFDNIFGDWETADPLGKRTKNGDEERNEQAKRFAREINSSNYSEWRDRILEFATTESNDLATFPVFYKFLAEFARVQPELAFRLISEDADGVSGFLIPILAALWDGPFRGATRELISKWVLAASPGEKSYLFSATKMFLSTSEVDIELLSSIMKKAAEIQERSTIRIATTVAIARYPDAGQSILDRLFYPAIELLTKENDSHWVHDVWYRKEARDIFGAMSKEGLAAILRNMITLTEIDYYAEEILLLISRREPKLVLNFLFERIKREQISPRTSGSKSYEAIPFEFHELHTTLSTIPSEVVSKARVEFGEDSSLFEFRGAQLLRNIFPQFSPEFENELLTMIRDGGEENQTFVVGVLRAYQGQTFIQNVSKELVKSLPPDSRLLTDVAIALETTGVVSGEFGMAEAYERKRKEIEAWLEDPHDRVRQFANGYVDQLNQMISQERKRAEERLALRKYKYEES